MRGIYNTTKIWRGVEAAASVAGRSNVAYFHFDEHHIFIFSNILYISQTAVRVVKLFMAGICGFFY